MARVIAIANQKGGVGKTTTAVNLAASLAAADQHTLLIDGDPQGNATSGVGALRDSIQYTVYDAIIGAVPLDDVILKGIEFPLLDVAPATADLAGAEVELVDHPRRDVSMRDALAPVRGRYDFVLIDCPPSLGILTVNMLAAADAILIPLQCEYYALEGLSQLLSTINLIQHGVNEGLAIEGVVLTMYDSRLNLSRQVVADAREYFGAKVFDSIVPRNIRLAEAPSFGKPIVRYDLTSAGAQAYINIARELLERVTGARSDKASATEVEIAQESAAPPLEDSHSDTTYSESEKVHPVALSEQLAELADVPSQSEEAFDDGVSRASVEPLPITPPREIDHDDEAATELPGKGSAPVVEVEVPVEQHAEGGAGGEIDERQVDGLSAEPVTIDAQDATGPSAEALNHDDVSLDDPQDVHVADASSGHDDRGEADNSARKDDRHEEAGGQSPQSSVS